MEANGPVVNEIAQLLDQCSPEELNNILEAIEGSKDGMVPGGVDTSSTAWQMETEATALGTATQEVKPPCATQAVTASAMNPMPPTAPPPQGGGRRPVPAGVKRSEGTAPQAPEPQLSQLPQPPRPHSIADDVKVLLEQHSNTLLTEVRKMLPAISVVDGAEGCNVPSAAAVFGDSVDMDTLTKVLVDRDREVQQLEGRLAELQSELARKDKRVAELGGELDTAVREVRHRQLDLEFQQLKLEERVRSNTELEQAQRMLTERVEEASLSARHAALDVEMCRSTPRTVRVQGTLPWTLRKNRIMP
mmetsp:Transcript_99673/g.281357  ORF Transcript_99673/g.281357 Transcript_99673/m.281357 type:complete len:304 (+) Transcript_99673:137-1048(+)